MSAALLFLLAVIPPGPSSHAETRSLTREVRFGASPGLVGQLDRPDGAGPFPVMVLIPGGGLSRRGTSSQFSAMRGLYDPLVEAAVQQGWAAFRFDRQDSPPGSRDEAQDIVDAVATARRFPDVDTRRIVICAHASGSVFLQLAYDRVEELVGFSALQGVVLLSSRAAGGEAGRMAGDILVVVGESAAPDERRAAENAVRTHRELYPRRNARSVVLPKTDVALCDTTGANWRGWGGMPGSCVIPGELPRIVAEFLRGLPKNGS